MTMRKHDRLISALAVASGAFGLLCTQMTAAQTADAGHKVAAVDDEPHPRQIRAPGSLLRLLLQPLTGRQKARPTR